MRPLFGWRNSSGLKNAAINARGIYKVKLPVRKRSQKNVAKLQRLENVGFELVSILKRRGNLDTVIGDKARRDRLKVDGVPEMDISFYHKNHLLLPPA